MEKIAGFFAPVLLSAVVFFLNAILPGRWVNGYISRPNSEEKMRYRLNGLSVFFTLILLWFLAGYFNVIPYDYLYNYRWYGLAGASAFGIIFSLSVVLPFRGEKNFFVDFFFGRTENLQLLKGRIDIKMWLYLTGATILGLNALSFMAHHLILYGSKYSPGMLLSTGLILYFLVDYLIFEEVHLYTYDLFAEKIGFKLGWGCLVFYPYFYAVFLWSTADLPNPGTPALLLSIYVLIFFCGWILARGANMQKYFFKKDPAKQFLGVTPVIITDGDRALLVNGFWGISRHINYLGEVLMATGIVLCTGYPTMVWPWLYPFYYIIFLVFRQRDDDLRCSLKYGELWKTYVRKVPWRIIPHIY